MRVALVRVPFKWAEVERPGLFWPLLRPVRVHPSRRPRLSSATVDPLAVMAEWMALPRAPGRLEGKPSRGTVAKVAAFVRRYGRIPFDQGVVPRRPSLGVPAVHLAPEWRPFYAGHGVPMAGEPGDVDAGHVVAIAVALRAWQRLVSAGLPTAKHASENDRRAWREIRKLFPGGEPVTFPATAAAWRAVARRMVEGLGTAGECTITAEHDRLEPAFLARNLWGVLAVAVGMTLAGVTPETIACPECGAPFQPKPEGHGARAFRYCERCRDPLVRNRTRQRAWQARKRDST
jgi:hypothetical protein